MQLEALASSDRLSILNSLVRTNEERKSWSHQVQDGSTKGNNLGDHSRTQCAALISYFMARFQLDG